MISYSSGQKEGEVLIKNEKEQIQKPHKGEDNTTESRLVQDMEIFLLSSCQKPYIVRYQPTVFFTCLYNRQNRPIPDPKRWHTPLH